MRLSREQESSWSRVYFPVFMSPKSSKIVKVVVVVVVVMLKVPIISMVARTISPLWKTTKGSSRRSLFQEIGPDSHHVGDGSNGKIDTSVDCLSLEHRKDCDGDVEGDFWHI